jgi:DinB family protein
MTPASIIRRQLDDVAALVMTTDTSTYTARPLPEMSGSIGEHVRHCLDHIGALVAASRSQVLSYDRRLRGTAVEADPAEALRQIIRLKAAVDRWSDVRMDDPICVTSLMNTAGEAVTGWSTVGRELAFVNSHTIHHQALIAVLLALTGGAVPDRLGFAPSTPRKAV